MSFQSNKAFIVADKDVAEAKSELENLFSLRDNIVIELKKYEEQKKEVKDLTSDIKKLSNEKSLLEKSLLDNKVKNKDLETRNKSLDKSLEDNKKRNDFLLNSILEKAGILKKLEQEIKDLSLEYGNKEKDYSLMIENLSKKIFELNEKQELVNKNYLLTLDNFNKADKEYNELLSLLSITRKSHSNFLSENKKLEFSINENQKLLNVKKAELEKIISDTNNTIILKKLEAEEEVKKIYKRKEDEIIEREGKLSDKESWLIKREQKLKEIKNELEVFYNKKIDNIIF